MGESSISDQIKHLTKDAPDPPNKWILISGS